MKRINIVYCAGSIECFEVIEGEVPADRVDDILTYRDAPYIPTTEELCELLITNLCQPREVALVTSAGPVPDEIMHRVQQLCWYAA